MRYIKWVHKEVLLPDYRWNNAARGITVLYLVLYSFFVPPILMHFGGTNSVSRMVPYTTYKWYRFWYHNRYRIFSWVFSGTKTTFFFKKASPGPASN